MAHKGFKLGRAALANLHARLDLEEARWAYNCGDGQKAYRLFIRAMEAVVIEPHPDSEEYRNGERKPPTQDGEQAQEDHAFTLVEEGTIDGPGPDRDADGYLVR